MASITVRNLDDDLKQRLRVRAAQNQNSMEQEVREILRDALHQEPSTGLDLVKALRARFAPFGGLELELPPREPMREPPTFD